MWHDALSLFALVAAGIIGALLQAPAAERARTLLRKR
jgi:hypothetical protein